jgi:hypothetical protein
LENIQGLFVEFGKNRKDFCLCQRNSLEKVTQAQIGKARKLLKSLYYSTLLTRRLLMQKQTAIFASAKKMSND